MKRNWKVVLWLLIGVAIASIAFIQGQFNSGWGLRNTFLFFTGLGIFISAFLYREENFIGRMVNTKEGFIYLASAILVGCIVLVYIWVISIGTWTTWPGTTNYYDLLGTAFSRGQLYIEEEPDTALIALSDPYDPDKREGIPVLWDLTLYNEKYFLYWGPVPALILAIVKIFYTNPVGDNILTFIFMVGLLIFQTALILEIHKNYFQNLPLWTVLIIISFTGLINPILYMLLEPRIYEAAVVSGQLFFIGGLFWLFLAFHKPSNLSLALAGIFFTLAVGSRTTLLLPIAFLVLVTLFWSFKSHPQNVYVFALSLIVPLVIGGASYAWYNYARFGSITEFGLSYQLTQTNIHEDLDKSFSLAYAPPNAFKLLINSFETIKNFPFIRATRWSGPAWYESYNPLVYDYFAEDITGILVGSPFLLFMIFALYSKDKNISWINISLAGSALLIFFTLLLFFYLTMRYLLDLIPVLCILTAIGFWQGFQMLQSRTARYLYIITGIGLWIYTISISIIICYASNLHRIRIYNPELIQKITLTFNQFVK